MVRRTLKKVSALVMCAVLTVTLTVICFAEPTAQNNYETTDTFKEVYGINELTAEWLFGHVNAFTWGGDIETVHFVGPAITAGSLKTNGDGLNYSNGVSSYLKGNANSLGGKINNLYDLGDPLPDLYVGKNNPVIGSSDTGFSFSGITVPTGTAVYTTDNFVDFTDAAAKLCTQSLAIYTAAENADVRRITAAERTTNIGGYNGYTVAIGETVIIEDAALAKIKENGYYIFLCGDFESTQPTVINIPAQGAVTLPPAAVYDKGKIATEWNGLTSIYSYATDNLAEQQAAGVTGARFCVDYNRNGTNVVWNFSEANDITVTAASESLGHVLAPNAYVHGHCGSYNGGFICKSLSLPNSEGHMFPMKATNIPTANIPIVTPPDIDPPVMYNITVTNGTADYAKAAENTTVTVTAGTPPAGQVFDKWEVTSGGATVASSTSPTSTFVMPANDVTIKATFKPAVAPPADTASVAIYTYPKDDDTKRLAGSEYVLYKNEGGQIEYYKADGVWVNNKDDAKIFTTYDNGGVIQTPAVQLPLGTYYFKETKAPTGYDLDASPITVTVDSSALASGTVVVKQPNTKTSTSGGTTNPPTTDPDNPTKPPVTNPDDNDKPSGGGGTITVVPIDPNPSKPNISTDNDAYSKEQDFWYDIRKEIDNSYKGDIVVIDAEDYSGLHWTVMDAARENNVTLIIRWDGKDIRIPAGKALNEKYRTYYPFEYLAKYNFNKKAASEIPAVPETGVNINLFMLLALAGGGAIGAVIYRKAKKMN